MIRRSFLALLGIGSAGVAAPTGIAGGNALGLAAVAGAAAPPPDLLADDPPEPDSIIAARQSALDWLAKNGLPEHRRQAVRKEAARRARTALTFPPEIEAMRSFSPSAKRRLYAEHLARLAEREDMEGLVERLSRDAANALVPKPVRDLWKLI